MNELLFLEVTDAVEKTTTTINWQNLLNTIVNWISTNGLKLVIGLVALFIIFKLINGFAKIIKNRMEKHKADKTITVVTHSIIRKSLKLLAFLAFLGYVGIDTAGIGTIIASLGVGIGLAVQGSLSNFAGGIVILIMRPFKIGDYIDAQGQSGTVEEIKVFYTYLVTPDNRVIMIPNGTLANGSIVNYSTKDLRRVDINFSISYEADFEKAKEILMNIITSMNLVLTDPAPFVRVIKQNTSSIDIVTRAWVKGADYWTVYFDLVEKVKKEFDLNGIEIPYNQLDVHVKQK